MCLLWLQSEYFNGFSFTHSLPSLLYIQEVLLHWDESCMRNFINHTHQDNPHLISMSEGLLIVCAIMLFISPSGINLKLYKKNTVPC